jgi:hypothetical protein
MTAQATAMPRQHPQGLTTVSGDRRHRRRALATAAIALAAPLFAVAVLAALGAATNSGGAGLGSLPGASGLKGESGTALPSQPVDPYRSKDFVNDYKRSGSAKKRPPSGAPDSNGRDTATKLPRQPVPAGFGKEHLPVTDEPSYVGQPGYPGGDTNVGTSLPGGTGGSGGSGSGSSGSSGSSGTGGSSGSGGSGGGTGE